MRFYYDWEFLDEGNGIHPISVGIVSEDGEEYYGILTDVPWRRVRLHSWLSENVVPFLPGDTRDGIWAPDFSHRAYRRKDEMASELEQYFIKNSPEQAIELAGWYSAYDHVCLMSLWGPMVAKPGYLPMYTVDLKQEHDRLYRLTGVKPPKPPQEDEHHALADAKWNRAKDISLAKFAREHGLAVA